MWEQGHQLRKTGTGTRVTVERFVSGVETHVKDRADNLKTEWITYEGKQESRSTPRLCPQQTEDYWVIYCDRKDVESKR